MECSNLVNQYILFWKNDQIQNKKNDIILWHNLLSDHLADSNGLSSTCIDFIYLHTLFHMERFVHLTAAKADEERWIFIALDLVNHPVYMKGQLSFLFFWPVIIRHCNRHYNIYIRGRESERERAY